MIAPIQPVFKPPRIVLPAPAFSRRWLAARIAEQSHGRTFRDILRRLSPQALAACTDHTWRGWYDSLITYLDQRLPLSWMAHDYPNEVEDAGELLSWGIPVAPLGIISDDLYDAQSPALLVCAALLGTWELDFARVFAPWPGLLERTANALVAPPDQRKLPRGYAWVAPWQAALDLYLYVDMSTGNAFLDYSGEEESLMNPPWNLNEVRSLVREWELGEPRYNAIRALQHHIDAEPDTRLHTLISVLAGQWTPDVLAEVAIKNTKKVKRG